MLDILNPCNDPNAWWQQLIMLAGPLLLGLLWAKGATATADTGDVDLLAGLDSELSDCRRSNQSAEANLKSIGAAASGSAAISNSLTAAAAPVVESAIIGATKSKKDDLKVVEGIGPKIEGLFNDAGIYSFAQLANTSAARLKEILVAAGSRYQMHDPTTWPSQSKLADEGKWEELKKWQDELNKGNA